VLCGVLSLSSKPPHTSPHAIQSAARDIKPSLAPTTPAFLASTITSLYLINNKPKIRKSRLFDIPKRANKKRLIYDDGKKRDPSL